MAPWIFSLMLYLVPASTYDRPTIPAWERETTADYQARLKEMASTIDRVVLDPAEPAVAAVANPHTFAAVALVVIGAGESGYSKDTYHGHDGQPVCYRGKGQEDRCDHGRSATPYQIMVGEGRTKEGWTKADLFGDFEKATRVALRLVRSSIASAAHCKLGTSGWLNAYGSGSCDGAGTKSDSRMRKIFNLLDRTKWAGADIPLVSDTMLARFAAAGAAAPMVLLPTLPSGGSWWWNGAGCALDLVDGRWPLRGFGAICLR